MNQHLTALQALAHGRRRGLGDPITDAISNVFPRIEALIDQRTNQINARIDQRANDAKAAALAEIDKKGDEASTRALIGGFVSGLVGVGAGILIGRAMR